MDTRETMLAKYLNDKYEEARRHEYETSHVRMSQNDFARKVGLSPQSLSQYMNAERLPEGRNKDLLIIAFGMEFLQIVGFDPSRAELEELIALYGSMDEQQRAALIQSLRVKKESENYTKLSVA